MSSALLDDFREVGEKGVRDTRGRPTLLAALRSCQRLGRRPWIRSAHRKVGDGNLDPPPGLAEYVARLGYVPIPREAPDNERGRQADKSEGEEQSHGDSSDCARAVNVTEQPWFRHGKEPDL